jgi:hypothetical protein
MAITTTDMTVNPKDGWVLIATAPLKPILVKPHSTGRLWFLAVAAAKPAATVLGMPMGRFSGSGEDNEFRSTDNDIAQNIYVRVPASSVASQDAADNSMIFSVIKGG